MAPRDDPATLEWEAAQEQARRQVLGGMLFPEVERLAGVAYEICQSEVRLRDFSRRGLSEALVEMLTRIPVYRAYVVPGEEPPQASVDILEATAARAIASLPDRSAEISLVRDLALGRRGRGAREDEFCVRFQQTTGPAVAKGVEDTAFYRWFPLSALDEVGGQPDRFGVSADEFHAWAAVRQVRWPAALTTLSTHDTKRSEDVRARLAVLSEVPGSWVVTMERWRSRTGGLMTPDGAEDGATGWLLWQTLIGAWPIDADRLAAYLIKATREAKLHTSWRSIDEAYEQHLTAVVHDLLSDPATMDQAYQLVEELEPGFIANVLGQRAIQLVTPGVPDIYQGCETVSLRLVDPDNRVPPDDEQLSALLSTALDAVPDPATDLDGAKMRLTALGLRLRRDRPELFGDTGSYEPLVIDGPHAEHAIGIVRGGEVAVTATRFAVRLAESGGWDDATTTTLPAGRWRDLLTGTLHHGGHPVALAALHAHWPVTLLERVS
jgi:(1->4)-alpha-D-glucan 1-alpha-D-glucosylmutase